MPVSTWGIPTKVLLHTAEVYTAAKEGALIGLRAENVSVDWTGLMARKKAVVDTPWAAEPSWRATESPCSAERHPRVSPKGIAVALNDGGRTIVQ